MAEPKPAAESVLKVEEPVKVDEKVDEKEMRRKELNDRRAEILKEFGGEANIPVSSEYWDLGNQLRAL